MALTFAWVVLEWCLKTSLLTLPVVCMSVLAWGAQAGGGLQSQILFLSRFSKKSLAFPGCNYSSAISLVKQSS